MTTYTYEIRTMGSADGSQYIYRVEDGAWIPMDEANSDYQAYLASLQTPQANSTES
jgi:hypothetical protein